jgi:hypothetical protein
MLELGRADRLSDLLVAADAQLVAFGEEIGGVIGRVWIVALLTLPVGDDLVGALRLRGNDAVMTRGADLARAAGEPSATTLWALFAFAGMTPS